MPPTDLSRFCGIVALVHRRLLLPAERPVEPNMNPCITITCHIKDLTFYRSQTMRIVGILALIHQFEMMREENSTNIPDVPGSQEVRQGLYIA
jgi:hypothetical protein